MPNVIHDYNTLATTQLLAAFNSAQDTLGRDKDSHLKRLKDHKTGIDRVMRAHEELVNMHGYAELELLDAEHARWIIERPQPAKAATTNDAAKNAAEGRVGATTIDLSEPLHLLVEINPKRQASRAHTTFEIYFALFEHGEDEAPPQPTASDYVEAMLAAGYDRKLALSTLHWDLDHEFIRLGESTDDVEDVILVDDTEVREDERSEDEKSEDEKPEAQDPESLEQEQHDAAEERTGEE